MVLSEYRSIDSNVHKNLSSSIIAPILIVFWAFTFNDAKKKKKKKRNLSYFFILFIFIMQKYNKKTDSQRNLLFFLFILFTFSLLAVLIDVNIKQITNLKSKELWDLLLVVRSISQCVRAFAICWN
jgi:hypothetical protein